MEKNYDPKEIETKWYPFWENQGYFKPSGLGPAYCIMLPPPNVTGTLHMGHAFQHTLMDALIRYHRMQGFNVLWQLGTDHAGIATEMVVGRLLEQEGKSRQQMGREEFVQRVWRWKEESGSTITRQMRRLGSSGDWSRERFTMDPAYSEAVIETFVRLHEQGLIYRGQRLVNWDPVLKTAISDLEVVSEEEDGKMWSIRYPLADGEGALIVATTRPETLLGDVAVAVHPEDERYRHLIGRSVSLPLTNRTIPIIADDYVDPTFGTGCVKITPAHDFNDYAVGKRHALQPLNIFTLEAKLNDTAPAAYRGLDRYVARKKILADLTDAGLLEAEKPHKLMVPRGDRSGQVVEPMLTDQWFVKMEGFAKRGLDLVAQGKIKFVPENWVATYDHWLENIQDWCISRQLWWGHRIPAWYDEAGRAYVGRDEMEVRRKHGLGDQALRQEDDVLETWFSSSLWSHATLGWPRDTHPQNAAFLPTSVLVTGFDIIFFWVARMIMMTDHFTGEVPFKEVYITGLVRDKDGNKMSKSKGNILDPIDVIDGIELDALAKKRSGGLMQPQMAAKIEKATAKEFPKGIQGVGADALRFTFAALATHGRDIKFDFARCEGYKNFCNKLWNAARFVLSHIEQGGFEPALKDAARDYPRIHVEPVTVVERWILSELQKTISAAQNHFAAYRFDLVAQTLYEFAWNEFCDWFLELTKPTLADPTAQAAASTAKTLFATFEALLRALHPIIPFVTEEIWQDFAAKIGKTGTSISVQPYPKAEHFEIETPGRELPAALSAHSAEGQVAWLKQAISQIRRIRSEMGISPGKTIPLLLTGGDEYDRQRMASFEPHIRFLCRVESIAWLTADEVEPAAATALAGNLKLLIPLAGLIDPAAEKQRLAKEIGKIETEIGKCRAKLASDHFVQNAPEQIVLQERRRLEDYSAQLQQLQQQHARLSATN